MLIYRSNCIFPIRKSTDNEYINNLKNSSFPLKNYGECRKNFCYGIPKLKINNQYFLLCFPSFEKIEAYEYFGRKICSSLGFDHFFSILYIFG